MKVNKDKKKLSALAVCLLLTAMLTIGGTLAYLYTSTEPVINTFQPVTPGIDIPEELTENVKKNATVRNTGTVDSYLRAKIIVTWQNSTGDVYYVQPTKDDYSITIGANWKLVGDYYYYKDVAAPGRPSNARPEDCLIVEAKPLNPAPADGYTLHIEILGQAVQATPETAIQESWGINSSQFISVQP